MQYTCVGRCVRQHSDLGVGPDPVCMTRVCDGCVRLEEGGFLCLRGFEVSNIQCVYVYVIVKWGRGVLFG